MFPTGFHKLQAQNLLICYYKREFKKIISLINQHMENPGIFELWIANRVILINLLS